MTTIQDNSDRRCFSFDMRRTLSNAATLTGRGAVIVVATVCSACSPSVFQDGFENPGELDVLWQVDAHRDCAMESTRNVVRNGKLALQISAPAGKRCEIVPRLYGRIQSKIRREPFDVGRTYRFSTYIENIDRSGDPEELGENTIVAQWHSSPDPVIANERGRGPPLALRIHDGRWGITYGWDQNFRSTERYIADNWHWLGDVETETWTDWKFRVVWSHTDGTTQVWKDNELVMDRKGGNTFNDIRGVYIKLGLYHPPGDQKIIIDDVEISNSP